MNEYEKATLDTAITNLEHKIVDVTKMVTRASIQLGEMRTEIERLKSLRDGKRFERLSSQDFNSLSPELQEALYIAVHRTVNDEYDLPQPMLARLVRDCVNNCGEIPSSQDRDAVAMECPHVLEAIERAHSRHVLKQLKGILTPPDAPVSIEDMNMFRPDDDSSISS